MALTAQEVMDICKQKQEINIELSIMKIEQIISSRAADGKTSVEISLESIGCIDSVWEQVIKHFQQQGFQVNRTYVGQKYDGIEIKWQQKETNCEREYMEADISPAEQKPVEQQVKLVCKRKSVEIDIPVEKSLEQFVPLTDEEKEIQMHAKLVRDKIRKWFLNGLTHQEKYILLLDESINQKHKIIHTTIYSEVTKMIQDELKNTSNIVKNADLFQQYLDKMCQNHD
jgi:hypothetical protein